MARDRRYSPVTLLRLLGMAFMLAACDPVYSVGARQYLSPAKSPAEDSAQSLRAPAPHAPEIADTTESFDVLRIADCLETTLRTSSEASAVGRSTQPKHLRSERAHMTFAFTDTSALGDNRYANLSLKALSGEAPVLELTFKWIGKASSVPLADQRTRITIATAFLNKLLFACSLPTQGIECVAEGWGGRRACLAPL